MWRDMGQRLVLFLTHPSPCTLPPFSEIEVCRQAQEATREAERRRQMVVVGDMQPLAAALPEMTPTTATQMQTG